MKKYFRLSLIITALVFQYGCQQDGSSGKAGEIDTSSPLFHQLKATDTGIYFKNVISESAKNNLVTNDYIYAGGGLAVGDLNNDELPDVVFISNQNAPGVYLNKGDFKFENITTKSKIPKVPGWSAGASIVDINNDGHKDIYICRGGEHERDASKRKNLLYINNGKMEFTERAAEFGLADDGPSTMAAFFDYDLDGDLDAYVLNYPLGSPKIPYGEMMVWRNNPTQQLERQESDRLYRNDNGKFTDVSRQAGIANWGYGLGVCFGDVNQDGYPDIYVTNDFEVDNFYYQNNGDGTFSEQLKDNFSHVSFYAMGVDMADFNNDGHLDIYEVEMLPEKRKRAITNMKPMDRYMFEDLIKAGMQPQYMRNSLQLNRGNGHFSDIAQFAGVNKTDWSWGTLIMDMDDDGHKDIYVANGIARDMKDRDFQNKGNQKTSSTGGRMSLDEMNALAPTTRIRNYVFHNQGNLKFEKVADKWGFDFKGFSNAVVAADFDLDGDLDIMVNNISDVPLVYKNTSRERGQHFLNIHFKGDKKNPEGIGNKVKIHTSEGIQYQELFPVRGYQSLSEAMIHFGLNKIETIDKIEITWADGKTQTLTDVKANQDLTIKRSDAKEGAMKERKKATFVQNITAQSGARFKHKETYYDDFKTEILLPHKMSQNGPGLATGDINGDGLDDFYIGGAANQSGAIYIQNANQTFTTKPINVFAKDTQYEDMGAVFFDADGDKDLDLYVVSGSNEFEDKTNLYQDRLYINDGKGGFSKGRLPKITASGSCVIAGDYDGDGDDDLYVGGRVVPQKYPHNPKSYLLQNNKGTFKDVTNQIAPELQEAGMMTSASWADYDKDGDLDLITVGEWTPIMVWQNEKGHFKNVYKELGLNNTEGWWSCIEAMDIDGDGDQDFVVGNIGLNHKFKASEEQPFQVFCNDFDKSGSLDIVLAFHQDGDVFPVRGRDCSSEQMPFLTEKFPTFTAFGEANLNQVYGDDLGKSLKKEAKIFSSVVLINNDGQFTMKKLPTEAQFSAINAAKLLTNKKGERMLYLAGNMFQTEVETSRADASIGQVLRVKDAETYEVVSVKESGFFVPGDVKDMKIINASSDQPIFLIANNADKMEVLKVQ